MWFVVSFGCGILFVDVLNRIDFGGFELGFWFAQQGSIVVFLLVIVAYVVGMGIIDRRHGVAESDDAPSPDDAPSSCLVVWFVVSFGCGILFVDVLNRSVSAGSDDASSCW